MINNEDKIFPPCPISNSSTREEFNDICMATGEPCPFYVDEGMSVCKNKMKCLNHFSRKKTVDMKQVIKLIFSDTKSSQESHSRRGEKRHKKTSHSRRHKEHKHTDSYYSENEFIESLEEAFRKKEEKNLTEGLSTENAKEFSDAAK